MKEAIWRRLGPACGVLFFALVFIGLFIHGYPDIRPTDRQLGSWIASVDVGRFTTGVYLEELGIILFIPFVVWLYTHLRRGDASSSWAALVMMASGLAWVVATLPINELYLGMLLQARKGLDINVAQTVVSISQAWFEMTFIAHGVFFGAAALAILRGGAMSRWAGWAAAVLGLAQLVPGPISFGTELVAYFAVVAVAGYYTVRPPRSREVAGKTAAAAITTELLVAR